MIESDLCSLLESIAPTYCGGIPQRAKLSAIGYQVTARQELQHQRGLSNSAQTHFRLSIYGSYHDAKHSAKSVKNALDKSGMRWLHEGEWDVFLPTEDGTANYFQCVAMNISIWSNETS